ncbi:uncharacterized protein LOC143244171 isoform X2 [Tachypleus tridentatus]|uniref:uncharacterized protein LOC143244171 isoform X2 n=1 Tax=Tachypleus tridentatus TaxID=6853 RepID=UPI003FCFF222
MHKQPVESWLLSLTLFLTVLSEGLAVKCYLCSYSPEDKNNQTDSCSDHNFKPNVVYSLDCEHGCETFIQWDSNGILEHSRRNCVQNGVAITHSCTNDTKQGWSSKRCTCDSDFCNTAAEGQLSTTYYSVLSKKLHDGLSVYCPLLLSKPGF